ncbi:MAG: MFS transporter [Bacteroidota bacterium]
MIRHARYAVSYTFFIIGFIYASWSSRLPRLTEMYGLNDADLSTVLLTIAIGALVAMPLTGVIIVRTGSRRLTAINAILFVVFTLLLLHSPGYTALLGFGFCLGIMNGSTDIAMNAQAIVVEDRMGKPIMSSFHAIFSLGMLVGAAGGYAFIAMGVDLRLHLLIVGLASIAGLLVSQRYLVDDPPPETDAANDQKGWRLEPGLLLIGFIAFCCMMGEGAMSEWTSIFLEEVADSSQAQATMGIAAFSGAMMMGRFGGDWARAKFGGRWLIQGGSLMAFGGLFIALLFPSVWLSTMGFLLVGIGLSNIVPIAYSIAGKYPGIPSGVGISTVTSIGYAGFLIGPVAIGYLSEYQKNLLSSPSGSWLGDWAGLQLGLGFVLLLFLLMVGVAFGRGRYE